MMAMTTSNSIKVNPRLLACDFMNYLGSAWWGEEEREDFERS
jgi:hypothetical protein